MKRAVWASGVLAILAVCCLAQSLNAEEPTYIESTYDGRTTRIQDNGDGTYTRTVTDHRTGETWTSNSGDDKVGGSSRNPDTGELSTSWRQPDGSHEVTVYDCNGVIVRQGVPDNRTGGSCHNPVTQRTTSSYLNPDGTHAVTVRDHTGRVISRRVVGQPRKLPVLIIHGRIRPAVGGCGGKPKAGGCGGKAPACGGARRVAPRPAPRRVKPCPRRIPGGSPSDWGERPTIIFG
jgi:hypothetical protein